MYTIMMVMVIVVEKKGLMEILRQDILSQQVGELNGLGQLDHVLSESKFLAIDSRILTW